MILVTGGAGFIGSHIVHALKKKGADVTVCDALGTGDKWKNLRAAAPDNVIEPENLLRVLPGTRSLSAVIHMGAISTTTECDADLIWRTNVTLSQQLWDWCTQRRVPFIYASSAGTYGMGEHGFRDETSPDYLEKLTARSAYAWSKLAFDRWAVDHDRAGSKSRPPLWAGLKFFNVYGPHEAHKGSQRSMVPQIFDQIAATGTCRLFRAHDPRFAQTGPMRDFVWVGDCADIALWIVRAGVNAKLLNIGTGTARGFGDLARATFMAMGRPEQIEHIDMPEALRAQYQYFTQADITKLHTLGYSAPLTTLEDGVTRYVRDHLMLGDGYM